MCFFYLDTRDTERSPLLNDFVNRPARSYVSESVGNFFTPQDSPLQSDDEDNHRGEVRNSDIIVNEGSVEARISDSVIPSMKSHLTPSKVSFK